MHNSELYESILGYQIFCKSSDELLVKLSENQTNSPLVVSCINPHSYVTASDHLAFSKALQNCDFLLPDGQGIVLAAKWLKGTLRKRLTGPDFFMHACNWANTQSNVRFFFLGSSTETLAKIQTKLGSEFPNIEITGVYSPPFVTGQFFSDSDIQAMSEAVNAKPVDFLWVGLTAPKQELLTESLKTTVNSKAILNVGAVFDFYAGNIKRSPVIFQKLGLEWLPRLLQEPKRLFKRNFVSTPKFLWAVIKKWFHQA